MKKLLFTLALTACSKQPGNAEIMVKAQVPSATCINYGTVDGINIARCTIGKDQGIAVYSVAHPFQFFPLKVVEQPKAQASTIDAGVDAPNAGSGSHAPTK
jgi:hypothetical protein